MSRSILRVRDRGHIHPDRADETVIEVVRDGEVVATIYGSLEGVHITSERLAHETPNTPFRLTGEPLPVPGFVIPLLASGETCPWCCGKKLIRGQITVNICPVCEADITEYCL